MIWYNDDDIEKKQVNWQNSEVMRIFAEQYLDPKLAEEAKKESGPGGARFLLADDKPEEEEEVEGGDDCGDGAPMGDLPVAKVIVVKEHLQTELDGVIQKLAGLSSQYGNEKVRYMMECAVDDLKAIQHYGE
jgi:hypothetical protein